MHAALGTRFNVAEGGTVVRAIRRILVAVKDPSARRLPAVTKAAQLATAFGSKIELFHDLTTTLYTGFPGGLAADPHAFEREQRAMRLDQLEQIAAPLRDRGLWVTVAAEWDYPAYAAIVRRAIAIKADLIVAQHHPGKRRLAWLLSFADWELLRLSPVPVLLVKSSRPYRRPVVLAALDPLHAFDKPARLDTRIVGYGSLVAEGLRGTLHAVHAYTMMPVGTVPAVVADARIGMELQRRASAIAGAAFTRVLRSTRIPRNRRHLLGGDPASVIFEVSRDIHSAIVVLGAVSRSGLKRAFIGNTAERLIDKLRSDLLVIKPTHFAVRIPRAQHGVRVVRPPGPMP
jgi:universal stress protein E